MCDGTRAERTESEIGRAIDEASVLGSQRDALGDRVICAGTLNERSLSLRLGSRQRIKLIPPGLKHERTTAGKNVWTQS